MPRKAPIASLSDVAARAALARGEGRTDWARAGAATPAEVEAQIAADPDEAGMEVDWSQIQLGAPEPKGVLNMRVDRDVLDFFRAGGPGYQTRIHAVLRGYVEQMKKRGRV